MLGTGLCDLEFFGPGLRASRFTKPEVLNLITLNLKGLGLRVPNPELTGFGLGVWSRRGSGNRMTLWFHGGGYIIRA